MFSLSNRSKFMIMKIMYDWIWENPASTHNYKYSETPILIIWSISYNLGRETNACVKFAMIL